MNCTACNYSPTATVTWLRSLVLQVEAPSLNTVGTNHRRNPKYRGLRRRYCGMLTSYKHNWLPAERPRRVYFTRFWGKGKRAYDYGNLVGGFKPLLDELVSAKLLVDDSPKWCSEYYRQFKSPDGHDYIVVTFEEIESETN